MSSKTYTFEHGDFFVLLTPPSFFEASKTPLEHDVLATETAVAHISNFLPEEDFKFVSVGGDSEYYEFDNSPTVAVVTGDTIDPDTLVNFDTCVFFVDFGIGKTADVMDAISEVVPDGWDRAVFVKMKNSSKIHEMISHTVHTTKRRRGDAQACRCDENEEHTCTEVASSEATQASAFVAPQTRQLPHVNIEETFEPSEVNMLSTPDSHKLREMGSTTPKMEKLVDIIRKQDDINKETIRTGRSGADLHRNKIVTAAVHASKVKKSNGEYCKCDSDICKRIAEYRKGVREAGSREFVTQISLGSALSENPKLLDAISSFGGAPFDRHMIYAHNTSTLTYLSEMLKTMRIPHIYVSRLDDQRDIDCILKQAFEQLEDEACHWYKQLRRERRGMEKRAKIHERSVKAFDKIIEEETSKECETDNCGSGKRIDTESSSVIRAELIQDVDTSIKACESAAQIAAAIIRYEESGFPWLLLTDTFISKDSLKSAFTHLHILDAGEDSIGLLETLARRMELERCKGIMERGNICVHYHITKTPDCEFKTTPEAINDDCDDDDLSSCCTDDSDDTCCGNDGVVVTYKGQITKEIVCVDGYDDDDGRIRQKSVYESNILPSDRVGTLVGAEITPYESEYETKDGNFKRIIHGIEIKNPKYIPPDNKDLCDKTKAEPKTKKIHTKLIDIDTTCVKRNLLSEMRLYSSFDNGCTEVADGSSSAHAKFDEKRFSELMEQIIDNDMDWKNVNSMSFAPRGEHLK